ncbi:MAG: T9SS type A sorting domain-containing protein [Melioribacteraceae bacterium]|nr:T9SS type A sorting domain-containing protein [Melioribacteraceae bacterium]WKZ70068.1 MAG: T9SS type A sorting domain-containing protein [Melioribacteraceae bacterium]
MKIKLIITLALLMTSFIYAQSSIVYDSGTNIEVGTGSDVSADLITVNGSYSGGGTFNNGPLPVELISFTGEVQANTVLLKWETATEVNNYGFDVQKSEASSQNSEVKWINIGFVQGNGTTNSPRHYEFTDLELPNSDEVSYRLKQIDNDGQFAYSKTVTVDLTNITSLEDEMIYEFALEQNFPNPFNPSTAIKYSLPNSGLVKIKIYDTLGREISTLVNEVKNAGIHHVIFNGSDLSSGIYFYKLDFNEYMSVKKLILVK